MKHYASPEWAGYDLKEMDDKVTYYEQLADALSRKADQIEKTLVRNLRIHLDGFEAGVSAIYNNLIDKGLLQPDPYKLERTITEIVVPSSAPYTEAEELHELSMRLSNYVSQWEFIRNIFHVGLNNLSLRKIGKLLKLIEYIRWNELSENSSYQTTRSLALIISKLSQRNDPMTGKIMMSTIGQLKELTIKLKSELKSITSFLRERYKYRVRDELINTLAIDPDSYKRNPQDVLGNVKFEFSVRPPGLGWYKELIQEILEEDFGEDSTRLRQTILEKLTVSATVARQKKQKTPDEKTIVLRILKHLARAGDPIRSSLIKMNENTRNIRERKRPFSERLGIILSSLFKRTDSNVVYEIRLKDALSGAVKIEAVDYGRFAEITMKRARTLVEMQDINSAAYQRANAAEIEQLIAYVNKYLSELKNIHKRMAGLDAYFQSNAVPEEVREQMKGCSLNLQTLKSLISESIREMNAFRMKREEEAQLKKLGIE